MIPLVFSLWGNLMKYPTSRTNKIEALSAILQVYSALLGMTEDDFKDLTHQIGEIYSGPLPDEYSQEIEEHYAGGYHYE